MVKLNMADKKQLSVFGLLKSVEFHRACGMIQDLMEKNNKEIAAPVCKAMLECDWVVFLEAKRKELGGEAWNYCANVIIFHDNSLIGDFEKFEEWLQTNYQFKDFRPLPLWHAMAKEKYKQHLIETKHSFVFLAISIDNEYVGKLIIELFTDSCPKTCSNFKMLCKGMCTEAEQHDPPLALKYQNSVIHRIVPNGWIQGGDFVGGKGTGGYSVFGTFFEDENYSVQHDRRGILGMANKGRHTNASQFYITLTATPWMNTKYVAFGKVIEGMDVLMLLERQETYNERPKLECRITECDGIAIDELWQ